MKLYFFACLVNFVYLLCHSLQCFQLGVDITLFELSCHEFLYLLLSLNLLQEPVISPFELMLTLLRSLEDVNFNVDLVHILKCCQLPL
jgi:hypothetical protein